MAEIIDRWIDRYSMPAHRMAARTAAQLVEHRRARKDRPGTQCQLSLLEMLDME